MMFESTYRRQAMNRLQQEKPALKNKLCEKATMEKGKTKDPFMYIITTVIAWFTHESS
ncbi:hypothetical protein HNQ94_003251 [Salirhabdus euzebyi]|uniref:Uncharacterized protein n=1 Tax=Salirhabdus euzebyi TaxID=394506 RepID=A0A841Q922_9BACI|nr:hypothetical protein [Salirhabdus euzebyi]MBB6454762.1 hypothetical protein [Salirhabdus euzebyi]